ncbi:MAG: DUF4328 domain-containing protein [Pseudomonadota bacterium]
MRTRRRRAGTQWFYQQGENSVGPFGEGEIRGFLSRGTLTPESKVRPIHSDEWQPLSGSSLNRLIDTSQNDENSTARPPKVVEIKPVSALSTWFVVSASIYAAAITLTTVSTALLWLYVSRTFAPEGGPYLNLLVTLNSLLQPGYWITILVFVSSASAYGFFYSYSLHNLRQLNAPEATSSPPSAWTWYFVPIANWFVPVSVFREIWSGSMSQSGMDPGRSQLIIAWWACWIIGNVGKTILNTINRFNGTTGKLLQDYSIIEIGLECGLSLLMAAAAICLVRLTITVASAQKQIKENGGWSVFD